ncbi:pilus assembly protein PilO [Bacillus infantis]|uniref:pilus assembly protein PilO n=1 Tax=Bacillus infantis TaxID=324767 RepID=UPI0021CCF0DA|nr:pilus assembly protein PilO [Bacillus infantis]
MNLQLSKKHLIIMITGLFLALGLAAGGYYIFALPLHDQLSRKQNELQMANQQLAIVESNLTQTNEKTILTTMELQKQVPVKRLLDQLLLDIEKAEVISASNILELRLDGTEADEEVDLLETASAEEPVGEGEETDSTEAAAVVGEEQLPNGIRQITLSLGGEAETYFELERFIESLESLKRIVKVEALNFTGLDEIYSVEQETEKVEFELSLAAYYYPSLEELQKELPPLDVPAVSNKQNPLSGFSSQESIEAEEDTQP